VIEVKLPQKGVTPDDEVEAICDIMQKSPELGFVYKAVVLDAIAQNNVRGSLWAVYLDGVPVGAAMIGSRRPYDHVYRTGDVTVLTEYRRRRLGTCLYTATAMQGILEGRREVEETVIASLSPWMVYSENVGWQIYDSVCGESNGAGPANFDGQLKTDKVDGPGFLRSLGYSHYGTLPKRTGGFRDIQLWCHSPIEIDNYLSRLPDDEIVIELQDVNHDRTVFERNMKNYMQHDIELAAQFRTGKSWLLSGAEGLVRITRSDPVADQQSIEDTAVTST
jgi:hypothetical protein